MTGHKHLPPPVHGARGEEYQGEPGPNAGPQSPERQLFWPMLAIYLFTCGAVLAAVVWSWAR